MPERAGQAHGSPAIYAIAAHRGFADALAAGLLARYREPHLGLARLTLLLPSQRAARTVTEAFVRLSGDASGGNGLLLPRMAVVGDLDLDETLGPLLDPLGAGADVPPAADPVYRWLRLAEALRLVEGTQARRGAALLRQAHDVGATMDRLLVEGVAPEDLMSERVIGIVGDMAGHWRDSTVTFLKAQQVWLAELGARGEIDAPSRRNLLFERAARAWRDDPPASAIVAAGVTSASPALARLLRVVAGLPRGAVVLPDLDLALDDAAWQALGTAGAPEEVDDPPFGRDDAMTHPQYHLKLLLNRMGVRREEVRPWHRAGLSAAPSERSTAISNLFLPAKSSARWARLPARKRRLSGVRIMEAAHPEEEALAIAILIRQALEVPERRAALVTPDRALAGRVVAHLRRWDIAADDSAGQPLSQSPAGRVLLLLAQVLAERAAPVPLIALLGHPLVQAGAGRAAWLERVRELDLALRGPRPAPGLVPLAAVAQGANLGDWWHEAAAMLAPLMALEAERLLADLLDTLAACGEALCGTGLWDGAEGRALSAFVEELRGASRAAGTAIAAEELHGVLRDAMERQSVRPPWGGHPRVAVLGLLEARMNRADLVICGGLVEGVWPGRAAPDPLLPPPVMRALGVAGGDFRIGLAAHDLAGALGAPQVVLSHARRDAAGPVLPSRFLLRIKAMLGDLSAAHQEVEALRLARLIDAAPRLPDYPRPQPMPSPEQRRVEIAVTALDRLRSDPYQFYASVILRLRSLDGLDVEPSPAWKGTAVHAILEAWHKAGAPAGKLLPLAETMLDAMSAHPLMRALWRPRLASALGWIDGEIARAAGEGRHVVLSEQWGDMHVRGVRVHGKADRIDRLPGGGLAIVDYKTGSPPSPRMVRAGYSLQLGVLGLIAADGGFKGLEGEPQAFEYWSLGRDKAQKTERRFGFVGSPFARKPREGDLTPADFLDHSHELLDEAIARWIVGEEPFTARLNPDIGGFNDYDQLMRLEEWFTLLTASDAGSAA